MFSNKFRINSTINSIVDIEQITIHLRYTFKYFLTNKFYFDKTANVNTFKTVCALRDMPLKGLKYYRF